MHPLIYVAGSYRAATREAISENIEAARQVGIKCARRGWYPVIPHTNTAHMETEVPGSDDEFWLSGTLELMTRCDAVVVVAGSENSAGTRGEIEKARRFQIPVFESIDLVPGANEYLVLLFGSELSA